MPKKHFYVAVDRPGAGWDRVIQAETLAKAKKEALRMFGEMPDAAYEVPETYEEDRKKLAEQQEYDRLGGTDFLIALQLAGKLPQVGEDFPNQGLLQAIHRRLELDKRVNPWRESSVLGLLNKDRPKERGRSECPNILGRRTSNIPVSRKDVSAGTRGGR